MFKSNTVVIVGAGASTEFGVPTGVSIFNEARNMKSAPRKNLHEFAFASGFEYFVGRFGQSGLAEQYKAFLPRLNSSSTNTIDRLAWLNSDMSDVCRAFSAWCIVKSLYEEKIKTIDDYGLKIHKPHQTKRLDHLNPCVGEFQNWIARCADKWIGDAKDHSEIRSGALTFVTFNYDLLIEEAFGHFVTSNKRFSETPKARFPEVLHVHGAFAEFPEKPDWEYLKNAAMSIKYIEDGGVGEAVEHARAAFANAEHIIAIGFDFDPKNTELLRLDDKPERIYTLNYNGNEGFDSRVQSLGVPNENILRGSEASPIGVSNAANRGFFDRPELLKPRKPRSAVLQC